VRREERALIGEYRALVERALARLAPGRHDAAVALADLPDMIRGYEDIKLDNVKQFRARAAELAARLG
jgi:indolepyruvate ferredoxin oxidoreductase